MKKILKLTKKFLKAFFYVVLLAVKAVWGIIKNLWAHKKGRFGLLIVFGLIIAAIFAPLITAYDPKTPIIGQELLKPSLKHPLGTDASGIDILTQILYGTRVSLIIGVVTGLSVTLFGACLGIIAGYFGKLAENIIMRIVDVLLVIPILPLMIILNKYVSSSYLMMITIFVLFGWSGTARIVRSQVLSLKSRNYVKAAELAGGSKTYIMFVHILPAVSHLLIMNCALSCAGFMIAEAGLSFLGLGDPTAVSWGQLLVKAEQNAFTSGLWAWVLAPGFAIFIAVLGFMQIGYALEEIFNPKMRKLSDINTYFKNISPNEIETAFGSMEEIPQDRINEFKTQYKLPTLKGTK